jgi:hypothetical protein
MLRMYVRTVQIKSEIQNSVKNPYFASGMGVNMEGHEYANMWTHPKLIRTRALIPYVKMR